MPLRFTRLLVVAALFGLSLLALVPLGGARASATLLLRPGSTLTQGDQLTVLTGNLVTPTLWDICVYLASSDSAGNVTTVQLGPVTPLLNRQTGAYDSAMGVFNLANVASGLYQVEVARCELLSPSGSEILASTSLTVNPAGTTPPVALTVKPNPIAVDQKPVVTTQIQSICMWLVPSVTIPNLSSVPFPVNLGPPNNPAPIPSTMPTGLYYLAAVTTVNASDCGSSNPPALNTVAAANQLVVIGSQVTALNSAANPVLPNEQFTLNVTLSSNAQPLCVYHVLAGQANPLVLDTPSPIASGPVTVMAPPVEGLYYYLVGACNGSSPGLAGFVFELVSGQSNTPTPGPSPTITLTPSPVGTATPTLTATPAPPSPPGPGPTNTPTSIPPTLVPTAVPTSTLSPTATVQPSATPKPTRAPRRVFTFTFKRFTVRYARIAQGKRDRVDVVVSRSTLFGIWMHVLFPRGRHLDYYTATGPRGRWYKWFTVPKGIANKGAIKAYVTVRLWHAKKYKDAYRTFTVVR